MAVDATDLVTRFPEFTPAVSANPAMVDAAIAEAARRIDVDVWGTKSDDGTLYLAAHLLAISPFGQNARLQSKAGESTYGNEHARMVREVSAGYRVA